MVLFVQPRGGDRSAEAYNHYREAVLDQQSFPVEAAAKQTWTNGAIAAGFATFSTGALVERFLAVNAVTDNLVVGLMISLCILAGYGMPVGAWLAIAWDGSSKSRERDHLASHLKALEQRRRRLDAIDAKRLSELAIINALPRHPWATQPK